MASLTTSYAQVLLNKRDKSSNQTIVPPITAPATTIPATQPPTVTQKQTPTIAIPAAEIVVAGSQDNGSCYSSTSVSRSVGTSSSRAGDESEGDLSDGGHDDDSSESNYKEKFIPAPPPLSNPWKKFSNAAAIIAAKSNSAQIVSPPVSESLNKSTSLQENGHISNEKIGGGVQPGARVSDVQTDHKFSNSKFHGSHIKSSQIKNCNKFKDRRYSPTVQPITSRDEWPELGALKISCHQNDSVKPSIVQPIKSSSTATESSDSGNEADCPNQSQLLSQEKWPSPQESSNVKEGTETETAADKLHTTIAKSKVKTGSNSTDEGLISGEEPALESEYTAEGEENSSRKKTKKSKWVPLNLPETAPKPRSPRRERPYDKSAKFRNGSGDLSSSESNGVRQSFSAPARTRGGGRGGSRGGGFRPSGRFSHHNNNSYYHQNFHNKEFNNEQNNGGATRRYNKDHNDTREHGKDNETNQHNHNQDTNQDYSSSQVYPASEFIMPYVKYPPLIPWQTYTTTENTDVGPYVYGGTGEEESLLIDIVRKQIEYYFSEENLEKDFYLRGKMDPAGWIGVRLISSFRRIQNMTLDYGLVLTAIRSSNVLELRKDMSSVRCLKNPEKWTMLQQPSIPQSEIVMVP